MLGEPLEKRHLVDNLQLVAGLVNEVLLGGSSLLDVNDGLDAFGVLEGHSLDVEVLVDNDNLAGTEVQGLEGFVVAVAELSGVHGDFVKVLCQELLLLDKLDVGEGLGGELDGLVEAVLSSVRDIDGLDDLGVQTVVKEIGAVKLSLEVGGTSQNQTGDVDLVSGDEVLDGCLGDLSDVVMSLFLSQSRESKR